MIEGDGVRRCLFCHTTNFRSVIDETGPEAADHSIGCERCHGPGGHHLAAVDAAFSDLAITSGRGSRGRNSNELCDRCHTIDNTTVISAPRTDPVWYRFPALTLTWSRCFSESNGKLRCVTCHDPHRKAETSAAVNEAKCITCHAASSPARCPVNPVKGCIDCHMPRGWIQAAHSYKTDHFIRMRERTEPGPGDGAKR
jgi:hypothetical protein